MSFTIAVYERTRDAEVEWTTLGLGPHGASRVGRSGVRVQRALVDHLRDALAVAAPDARLWFQPPSRIELQRLRLELALRGTPGRRTVTGLFPVVVQSHWVDGDRQRDRIYHPARQPEWAWLDPDHPIELQARELFQAAWGELWDPEIESLRTSGKDRVRRLSFEARPKTLLDDLPGRPAGPWADLEVDPLRKKREKRKARALVVLREVASDLTFSALEGTLPLGVPREPYRSQLDLLLSGPRKRSVVVIGPPRSGKSTLLYRWVRDLAAADGFDSDRNFDRIHHVYRLTGGRIIAGMTYLGQWEERAVALLEEARENKVVLFIDDLHAFGQLGRTRDSERNLAELFRGPVGRGEAVVVTEATRERWQRLEDDAPSFASLFAKVVVQPTDTRQTLELMFREARELERARRIEIEPYAYKVILDLGGALFPEQAEPGKSIDLLRGLAEQRSGSVHARVKQLLRQGKKILAIKVYRDRFGVSLAEALAAVTLLEPGGGGGSPPDNDVARQRFGVDDVLELLSGKTGLPRSLLALDETLDPEAIERTVARHVLGQPEAARAARDLFVRVRAGLTAPRRPLAVYLLTGPTGTGKTELAKTIASMLYGDPKRLVRFDMAEYATRDAVPRLIGDAWQPRGELTERIRQQRFCVLLLDEIDKAHRSVLYLMLQLFDDARLTDAAGDTADFSHAVVLMTSNLGARATSVAGFGAEEGPATDVDRAVREFFPPELFNRIDRIVPFAPLDRESAALIARKELRLLLGRRGLVDRSIYVTPTASVVEQVVAEAFDPRLGARPVKRWLEERVGGLLTDHISGSGRAAMQSVRLYVAGGELRLHAEPLTEAEPSPGRYELRPHLDQDRDAIVEALRARARDLGRAGPRGPLGRLAEKIGERFRSGGKDALFELELARLDLESLRDRLDDALRATPSANRPLRAHRGGSTSGRNRPRLDKRARPLVKGAALQLLAETMFLSRVLRRAEELERHAAFVEVLRVGEGSERPRRLLGTTGLSGWLVSGYAQARGRCEEIAARRRGEPVFGPDEIRPKGLAPDLGQDLGRVLAERPDHVVLKMVGLCAVDYFAGEEGCHVWESLASGTEVVRVRVSPVEPGASARDVMERHLRQRQAFDEALEAGREPLPPNPEALLPAVRRIRFDPPPGPGETARLEIEDYAVGDVRLAEVASPLEVLRELWRLRMTLADGPGARS